MIFRCRAVRSYGGLRVNQGREGGKDEPVQDKERGIPVPIRV